MNINTGKFRDSYNYETQVIFTYGTIMAGGALDALTKGSLYLGRACTTAEYTLLDLQAFPGLVNGGTTKIEGELYMVNTELLPYWDKAEGRFFDRRVVGIESPVAVSVNGIEVWNETTKVEAYIYTGGQQDLPIIASGNWAVFESIRDLENELNNYQEDTLSDEEIEAMIELNQYKEWEDGDVLDKIIL